VQPFRPPAESRARQSLGFAQALHLSRARRPSVLQSRRWRGALPFRSVRRQSVSRASDPLVEAAARAPNLKRLQATPKRSKLPPNLPPNPPSQVGRPMTASVVRQTEAGGQPEDANSVHRSHCQFIRVIRRYINTCCACAIFDHSVPFSNQFYSVHSISRALILKFNTLK
jgi:hypothetical protein